MSDDDLPAVRLSIVIPHLNEPALLHRCLLALCSQRPTAPPFEIIVADNGSEVPPREVCAGFEGVHLVLEATPGPGPARNAGSRLARGDIIGFIDSDCVAQPGWVRTIVEFMDAHPEVDFLGGCIRVLPRRPGEPTPVEAYEDVFSYRARMFVEQHHYAATGNMAVRRHVFQAVGPFEGISTYEDVRWGQRATAMGFRIAYLPDAVVFTPGCGSLAELAQRLQRFVVHDFLSHGKGVVDQLRWALLSVGVAVSPLVAVEHIARSNLGPLRLQVAVFCCLVWARWFRARLMLQLLNERNPERVLDKWKR